MESLLLLVEDTVKLSLFLSVSKCNNFHTEHRLSSYLRFFLLEISLCFHLAWDYQIYFSLINIEFVKLYAVISRLIH